ncbi:MAG: class I SAM-dependent methyltransferase [Pyrinomonadaceae bacterium]|nr:class I SAM-dependent methyltransferase [Pyrinomonadaceae bacterium]
MIRKISNLVKWGLILGKEPQNFLGAKWIPAFLDRIPDGKKQKWALRILNLSPHYFLDRDEPQYAGMSTDEYLKTAFANGRIAREEIYDQVFKEYLNEDDIVLEYGCGPGYVAKAVAPHVRKLYACDISPGAIACAKILNNSENIEYILADEAGLSAISDSTLDAVCSFAVIQHLTDEVFEIVLENCRKKLKQGGRLVFHVQLEDDVWKPEEEWKNDKSFYGKVKFKYGLHCFGRTRERHREIVERHGFENVEFKSLLSLGNKNSSDADSQFLMTATKS